MSVSTEKRVTQELVNFAFDQKYDALPDDVVEVGRNLIIDSIGCALGGHGVTKGAVAVAQAADFGSGTDATILGGPTASLFAAAFANGELMNAIDMDAVLIPGHITPYVVPPVLAAAEKANVSGRDLIRGIVVAHEISARVGGAYAGLRTNLVEDDSRRCDRGRPDAWIDAQAIGRLLWDCGLHDPGSCARKIPAS